ncbi:Ubiquitin specific protease, conserved site [Sesbania bispinosa]|nr:Ubiquitin specific protease, conserved site [Sesbania bispinosa]
MKNVYFFVEFCIFLVYCSLRAAILRVASTFAFSRIGKVDYPLELDVYDLCSDDLRKTLEAPRQILRNEEGKRLGLKVNEKSSVHKENDVKMSDAEGSSNGGGEPSVAPMEEGEKETQMTGIYDLVAVLTHKGRSADSGHYVGWVKQENGKWIEFDDDNPKPKLEEDITRLSGGDSRIVKRNGIQVLYFLKKDV